MPAQITDMTTNTIQFPSVGATAPQAFISKLEDQPVECGLDQGHGTVTWRTLISSDRTPSSDFLLGWAEFPPNGVLHLHRHEPPEFYLCLAGSGIVTIDGCEHRLAVRTAVYVPGNAEHGVIAGHDGLTFAYGFAKDSFADINYVFSEQSHLETVTAA